MPAQGVTAMTAGEVRAVQLELLDVVDEVCRAAGLRYFFWAGTLLGAIRHRGVIPWDDDIDLAMPRADYERLCRELAARKPETLDLFTAATRAEYAYPFARIADKRSLIREGARISVPMGAFIDVFPMDGWPRGRALARLHWLHMTLVHFLVTVWGARPRRGRELHKRLAIAALKPTQWVPIRWLTAWITKAATRYPYETAEHVGVTVFHYVERVERAAYGDPIDIEFEGRTYRAGPEDPDRILTSLYGDYMTLPPESERGDRHHIQDAHWVDGARPDAPGTP